MLQGCVTLQKAGMWHREICQSKAQSQSPNVPAVGGDHAHTHIMSTWLQNHYRNVPVLSFLSIEKYRNSER